jgi:hypothetical protein
MYDLGALAGLPAADHIEAVAINNAGQIIVNAYTIQYPYDFGSFVASYLLTPLPPPFQCPPLPASPTVTGQIDFGGQIWQQASAPVTCKYPVKVPKGSQFIPPRRQGDGHVLDGLGYQDLRHLGLQPEPHR